MLLCIKKTIVSLVPILLLLILVFWHTFLINKILCYIVREMCESTLSKLRIDVDILYVDYCAWWRGDTTRKAIHQPEWGWCRCLIVRGMMRCSTSRFRSMKFLKYDTWKDLTMVIIVENRRVWQNRWHAFDISFYASLYNTANIWLVCSMEHTNNNTYAVFFRRQSVSKIQV